MSVGTTLEWFDFGLYGVVAALVFPQLFFPPLSGAAGVLASFASFGVGLLVRPLGALVFAHFGDRIGRKRMLVVALLMMSFASLGIAVLPGYHAIGLAAPILLLLLRCVQGLSLGGETSTAQVMAVEYAPAGKRGLVGALVNLGSPLGQILVTVTLVLTEAIGGRQAFLATTWRIPFVVGFLMAFVGLFIRMKVAESPMFEVASGTERRTRAPLVAVIHDFPGVVFRLTLVWTPQVALYYVVAIFSLHYISDVLKMPPHIGLYLLLAANSVGAVTVVAGGRLSDRFGRRAVLAASLVLTIGGMLAYFPLLNTKMWGLMLLGSILTLPMSLLGYGALPAMLAEPFPTKVRLSGHATIFTLGNVIGGAPTPFVAEWLIAQTSSTVWLTVVLVCGLLIGLIALTSIPESRHLSLTE
ncbi:MFS transporter [Dactylosporangium sucinum]|uniref:MFS transporter n=1 Tax=Dactylosporangium sucinum TaxID=1424081 RepID=A0A917X5I6_9ACTN|nr:MFS transporter [Dactylosporangium sucinum]GGM67286.1 MFS transporter [Dactylosporangium sucinum]